MVELAELDRSVFPKDIDVGAAPDLFNSFKRSESHILDDLVDGLPLPFRGRRVVQCRVLFTFHNKRNRSTDYIDD